MEELLSRNTGEDISTARFLHPDHLGSARVVTNADLGVTFSYDQENFMAAAGGTISYKMDAQGRRVRKTVGSTVTEYFYVGEVVISEKQGSTWTDYIFLGGQRIAKQTGSSLSTATFLHTDHLGSTRVCTDSSGTSTGTCHYEPFGEFRPGTTCSVPTVYRFAGMEWDGEIGGHGLYHTWFRQYDPSQGRWLGVDPVSGEGFAPQSLGRYSYVWNDPVNLTDLSGLYPSVTCTLDGIPIDCGFVPYGVIACPNNDCFSLTMTVEGDYLYQVKRYLVTERPYGWICDEIFPEDCVEGFRDVKRVKEEKVLVQRIYRGFLGRMRYDLETRWLQDKVFWQAIGRNFVETFQEGGCFRYWLSATGAALGGVDSGSAAIAGEGSSAAYYTYKAGRHRIQRGLSTPLSSSIFRGYLGQARLASGYGLAISAISAGGVGLFEEYGAARRGDCK